MARHHVFHREAQAWFARKRRAGFRTCPITETGFVRISSNPAFVSGAVTRGEALALLRRMTRLRGHDFWADDLPFQEAAGELILAGHRQVTDLYLLALAAAHGGVLATFDRGVADLAQRIGRPVEVIR